MHEVNLYIIQPRNRKWFLIDLSQEIIRCGAFPWDKDEFLLHIMPEIRSKLYEILSAKIQTYGRCIVLNPKILIDGPAPAIIAYNAPITRVQLDSMRGVGCVSIIRKLLAKGFIKEVGRSDLPGRPILYDTTSEFLDYFGLSTKEDLPSIDDFIEEENKEVEEETDLYTSKYKEVDE